MYNNFESALNNARYAVHAIARAVINFSNDTKRACIDWLDQFKGIKCPDDECGLISASNCLIVTLENDFNFGKMCYEGSILNVAITSLKRLTLY